MRIRWKLLGLLLLISLVPILLLRWNGASNAKRIAAKMADMNRAAITSAARKALSRLVEDHAVVLNRESRIVELALDIQSADILRLLHDPAPASQSHADGLPVEITFQSAPPAPDSPAMQRIEAMGGVYRRIKEKQADLVLTQRTYFVRERAWVMSPPAPPSAMHGMMQGMMRGSNGNMMTRMHEGMQGDTPPEEAPRSMNLTSPGTDTAVVWSPPRPDPVTGKLALTATKYVYDGGELRARTSILVPLDTVLSTNRHISHLSRNSESMLVAHEIGPTGVESLRILAHPEKDDGSHARWMMQANDERLPVSNVTVLAQMGEDLRNRESGVLDAAYDGRDSFWAYAPVDDHGTALLLIVPKADLTRSADAMETAINQTFRSQLVRTGWLLAAMVFVVLLAGTYLSGMATRDIRSMAEQVQRLAQGDFSARVDIRSGRRDELAYLGRAFNKMVPALEDRMQLKGALELAKEVQQRLLPTSPPVAPGLDVAGDATYCDETGGDCFDFPPLPPAADGAPEGVAVSIGDVSGHGLPAALLMATARAYLRATLASGVSLGQAAEAVSAMLFRDTDGTGQFMTLLMMRIDPERNRLEWVRAGHDPAMLRLPDGTWNELQAEGLPLGVVPDNAYALEWIEGFVPGSILVAGTDGIWETRGDADEMYGKERLRNVVDAHAGLTAAEIARAVLQDADAFRSGPPDDDSTVVVVKRI